MSVYEYTVDLWKSIFGDAFAQANTTLINNLSTLTVILMVGLFTVVLCSVVRSIFRRCTP